MKTKSQRRTVVFVTGVVALTCLVLLVWSLTALLLPAKPPTSTDTGAQNLATAVSAGDDEVVETNSLNNVPEIPLALAFAQSTGSYNRTDTLESWHFIREESCADLALVMLEAIYQQDFELIQAGFMDVSGECWGCTFTDESGTSLMITLIPEQPFSARSDTNRLNVSILQYLKPEELL